MNLEELVLAYLANPGAGAALGAADGGDETAVSGEDDSAAHPARSTVGGEEPR